MALPLSTRAKIAENMGIQKVRPTHVSDNKVVDDGYNLQDVENAIKVASMQAYLNSTETDVTKLFQMLIDDAEGKTPAQIGGVDFAPVIEDKPVKKRAAKVTKKKQRA